jgi:hypothetical protein
VKALEPVQCVAQDNKVDSRFMGDGVEAMLHSVLDRHDICYRDNCSGAEVQDLFGHGRFWSPPSRFCLASEYSWTRVLHVNPLFMRLQTSMCNGRLTWRYTS